ncbi:MAG TPA: DUF3298 domain-containing protein [Candidatus Limnocylindrales bacterium]|nr:DUF3298 domain-containing protein [Candidatus Limnocylindrales bacterium]
MMKRSLFVAGLLALVLSAAALPAFAHEEHCMEVGGQIDKATGECIQHAVLDIKSVYPIEAAHLSDAMAEAIDSFINGSYAAFVGEFANAGFIPGSGNSWALDIQNEIVQGVSTVSVVFTRYTYTGGANGTQDYATITADFASGSLLTLEDVFMDGVDPYTTLQPLAEAALTELLGDAAIPDMMAPGLELTPENYRRWALTTDSLNLYFDEYQVAPGAAGSLMVSIPLSSLSGVLQPQFLS